MPQLDNVGMPGIGDAITTSWRRVLFSGEYEYLGQGRILSQLITRDPGNVGYELFPRAGLLIGKSTANPLAYGASVIGLTSAALALGATTLTVPFETTGGLGVAGEIRRRFGQAGTFKLVGPPAAAGVVATQLITYSAVNVATGVLTITAAGAAAIAGSLIQPADGTENFLSFLTDGFPYQLQDTFGNATDVELPKLPVGGQVDDAQLLNWPADTSLQTYVKTQLNAIVAGNFVFKSSF